MKIISLFLVLYFEKAFFFSFFHAYVNFFGIIENPPKPDGNNLLEIRLFRVSARFEYYCFAHSEYSYLTLMPFNYYNIYSVLHYLFYLGSSVSHHQSSLCTFVRIRSHFVTNMSFYKYNNYLKNLLQYIG